MDGCTTQAQVYPSATLSKRFPDSMLSSPSPKWRIALNSLSSQKSLNGRPPVSTFTSSRCASLIVPRIYLTDLTTARNHEELLRLEITHVVSILDWNPAIPSIIPDERKLYIRLADSSDADILTHLPETTEFINSALSENATNKVLVHCFMGVSRSATVVCAYLIASSGMQAEEAIDHTQAKRSVICPNLGFRAQLERYAEGFAGKQHRRGDTKAAKIEPGIAERIRQLRTVSLNRQK